MGEQRPVRVHKFESDATVANVSLRSRDAIHDVRRREIELPQTSMKLYERLCVVGRGYRVRYGIDMGPQSDLEAVWRNGSAE